MPLVQIGPLTTLTEAAAASVAAGVVLSSVAAGVVGLTTGRSKDEIEEWTLRGGYFGGGVGAAVAFVDAIARYVIL
jgi:enolase